MMSRVFQALNIRNSRLYSNRRLYINSTVTVAAVNHTHNGAFTCTALSRDGVTKATATLRVVGKEGGRYHCHYGYHGDVSKAAVPVKVTLVTIETATPEQAPIRNNRRTLETTGQTGEC